MDKRGIRINEKKAQVAVEFLATYGWAILIVMIAIAALSYFGFTSPQKILPDKCIFGNGIVCQDSHISRVDMNISVVNTLGRTIYNIKTSPDGFVGSCSPSVTSASGDTPIKIDCKFSSPMNAGEKKKFRVFLNYTKTATGFTQVSQGEVYGTVQ